MGKNSNAKRLKKNERKNLGGDSPKKVDKSSPEYIAKVKADRAAREAEKNKNKAMPRVTRRQKRTTAVLNEGAAAIKSNVKGFTIDQFIDLKPIIDSIQNNPTSKVSISKSQARKLANLNDEQFNYFLSLIKQQDASRIFNVNRISDTAVTGRFKNLQENIDEIKRVREERVGARNANPDFLRAQKRKEFQQFVRNMQQSEKDAVAFLKQTGKPLDHLTQDLTTHRKNVRATLNNSHLNEINNLNIPGLSKMQTQILRQDLMQEYLDKDFLKKKLGSYEDKISSESRLGFRVKLNQNVKDLRRSEKKATAERLALEAKQRKAQEQEERLKARATAAEADKQRSITTIDYTQKYQGSIVAEKNQQKAIARAQAESAAAARQARMSSSMADNIAQDTMRAASVIHSSKLGFAAIGAGAIGAAFGITSLRNKKEQRRRELERG